MRTLKTTLSLFVLAFGLVLNTAQAQDKNIVELAAETESLSTLVTAVKAAGLAETLQQEGPYTVFAPTNDAFNALPDGTLEMLLKPENKEKLQAVLTYHVVAGSVKSGDLSDGMNPRTVNGNDATVNIENGNVMVDNANVVQADVNASNGVVHVIDSVILPPSIEKALSGSKNGKKEMKKEKDW